MSFTWIKDTEVAKAIRLDLAKSFPGVKFSVTTNHSIRIRWTDGPTSTAVENLVGRYKGEGFDGMIDLRYDYWHWLLPNGSIEMGGTQGTVGSGGTVMAFQNVPSDIRAKKVHLGTSFIFRERSYSETSWRAVLEQLDYPPEMLHVGENGRCWIVTNDYLQQERVTSVLSAATFSPPAPPAKAPVEMISARGPVQVENKGYWTWMRFQNGVFKELNDRLVEYGGACANYYGAWFFTRRVSLSDLGIEPS